MSLSLCVRVVVVCIARCIRSTAFVVIKATEKKVCDRTLKNITWHPWLAALSSSSWPSVLGVRAPREVSFKGAARSTGWCAGGLAVHSPRPRGLRFSVVLGCGRGGE